MTGQVFIWNDMSIWRKVLKNSTLKKEYTHIRGYHACRPIDFDSYYKNGLRILNLVDLKPIAVNIFCSHFPDLTPKDITEGFEYVNGETRQGFLYFAIDKRELLTYSGHYLIYGSEFLHGVAVYLRGKHGYNYSSILKNMGIPTIFECNIPIEYLNQSTIDDLDSILQKYVNSNLKTSPRIDFSLIISKPINSDLIVNHSHPKRIPDPINQMMIYISPNTKCPLCR
jgi:hypothetical protein